VFFRAVALSRRERPLFRSVAGLEGRVVCALAAAAAFACRPRIPIIILGPWFSGIFTAFTEEGTRVSPRSYGIYFALVGETVGRKTERMGVAAVVDGELPWVETWTGRMAVGEMEFPRCVPCTDAVRVTAGELPRSTWIGRTAVVPIDGGRVERAGKN